MGQIPEDENNDEFMNASAEEWSKPEEAPEIPEVKAESTDRWGSSTADKEAVDSGDRWGSEPLEPTKPKSQPKKEKVKEKVVEKVKEKKSGSKWWIIAILVLVVLCICVCVTVFGLSYFGITNIDWSILDNLPPFP